MINKCIFAHELVTREPLNRPKVEESLEIAAQIAEFEARGGKIKTYGDTVHQRVKKVILSDENAIDFDPSPWLKIIFDKMISRADLAKKTGVSLKTINKVLDKKGVPDSRERKLINEFLASV